jgi:hypothetical protein
MKNTIEEASSFVDVSFLDENMGLVFQNTFSTASSVYTIIEYWENAGEDFFSENINVSFELPNRKKWEELTLMGTDENKLLYDYSFNIVELISSDREHIDEKSVYSFQAQLESNKKRLESILGVDNLLIDWGGPGSSNNIPNELAFYFDSEIAFLYVRITLDWEDLNKSMKIADLLANFTKISTIVKNSIQGVLKYRNTY